MGGTFKIRGVWSEHKRKKQSHTTAKYTNCTNLGELPTMPSKCHHGVWKFWCKPCGGGGYCQHDKNRYLCQECKDDGKATQLCDHGQPKSCCAQCGNQKCQHGNHKRRCRHCGTGSRTPRARTLCQHGKRNDKKTSRGEPFCRQCRGTTDTAPGRMTTGGATEIAP